MQLKITTVGGEAPGLSPLMLGNNAQVSRNLDAGSNEFVPLREDAQVIAQTYTDSGRKTELLAQSTHKKE